jgi:Tfp pilus assembly protein PilO
MIHWWNEIPTWQRFVFFGLAVALFVLGMHSWVWSSLDSSIAMLTHDIAGLTQKNQESIQNIALLKGVEQEVVLLREKLSPTLQQLPVGGEPLAFRREIVDIGKRRGVSIRLWNPPKKMRDSEQSDASLDIIVRVEGSFFGTVQFLDDLLQLSWIQTVNPLVIVRKQDAGNASLVTTDFTIKGVVSESFLQTKELLKT